MISHLRGRTVRCTGASPARPALPKPGLGRCMLRRTQSLQSRVPATHDPPPTRPASQGCSSPPVRLTKVVRDIVLFLMWSICSSKRRRVKIVKKTWGKSISVGINHAMNLVGELHKNECETFLWAQERASKTNTSIKTLPPFVADQNPSPCQRPPLLWNKLSKEFWDHPTSHHHDIRTNNASPGKANNGILGSCLCNTCTNDASPGKAANGTSGGSHHNATFLQCLAKCCKAENPHQRPIAADGTLNGITAMNGFEAEAANHARIWPRDIMKIIKSITRFHSPRPVLPLFVFEMTVGRGREKFPCPES
jgi:hypothetical protein